MSSIENNLAGYGCFGGQPVVDHMRCHQSDPRMMMFVVVPTKEGVTKRTGVLDRSEAIRKLWPVFKRFELAFGIRIVVGDVGTAVGFGNA